MAYRRGNTEKDLQQHRHSLDIILKGVTLEKLKKTFERIGDYPKPKPNPIGRPKHTLQQKKDNNLQKIKDHDNETGQTNILL